MAILPVAWEQRKLGDVAEFNPPNCIPDVFEYVDLESVIGTKLLGSKTFLKDNAPSRAQRLAQQGDLFFQTVRPYQKNNYFFQLPFNNYVFSTGYAQLRPFIDGYFLLSLVQNNDFVNQVIDKCTGTSYPAISSKDLAKLLVQILHNAFPESHERAVMSATCAGHLEPSARRSGATSL